MHIEPMAEHEGTFGTAQTAEVAQCGKCKSAKVTYETWDSSCGGYVVGRRARFVTEENMPTASEHNDTDELDDVRRQATERPFMPADTMIRAIIAGTKTQTRLLIKSACAVVGGVPYESIGKGTHAVGEYGARIDCPYGGPGDRLWLKESWRSWQTTCDEQDEDHRCGPHCAQTYVAYAATPRVGYRPVPDRARITYLDESTPIDRNPNLLGPWNGPIFMPRWASRCTLDVVSVRVERIQDMTDADAMAEGVTCVPFRPDEGFPICDGYMMGDDDGKAPLDTTARAAFARAWGAGMWAINPWVWRVEFRKADVSR